MWTTFIKRFFFPATKASLKQLRRQIPNDESLRKALTPQFQFGCKRMLLTNDYYPALSRPNCTVHTSTITNVNDHSITMENGVTQKLDVRNYLKKIFNKQQITCVRLFGHRYSFWLQASRYKTFSLHCKLLEKDLRTSCKNGKKANHECITE